MKSLLCLFVFVWSVLAVLLLLLATQHICAQPFTLSDPAMLRPKAVASAPASWAPTNAYGRWYAGSLLPTSDGTAVTTVADSSSTHPLYVIGANSANAPYFTNNGLNSLPAWYFSGASGKALTNALGTTLAQPLTFFIVAADQYDGSGTAHFFWDNGNGNTRNIFAEDEDTTVNHFHGIYAGSAWQQSSTKYTNTVWALYTVCFNGANSFVRTNGHLLYVVGGSPGTDGEATMTIGGHYDGVGSNFKGWMAEILLYKGLPATNDMQWIESNLCTKYNLPYAGP